MISSAEMLVSRRRAPLSTAHRQGDDDVVKETLVPFEYLLSLCLAVTLQITVV